MQIAMTSGGRIPVSQNNLSKDSLLVLKQQLLNRHVPHNTLFTTLSSAHHYPLVHYPIHHYPVLKGAVLPKFLLLENPVKVLVLIGSPLIVTRLC